MRGLTYTLLADGSSDRLLDFPIRWVLRRLGIPVEMGHWADLSRARPAKDLPARSRLALELYPAQLLFLHRDAENVGRDERLAEIRSAVSAAVDHFVAVVPVRMSEAWFLHDEPAIRRASGNPNGRVPLNLPAPARVEELADPKQSLRHALLTASELSGRRLESKKSEREFGAMRTRTAELIEDFEPLRAAPAFAAFTGDLVAALRHLGYGPFPF